MGEIVGNFIKIDRKLLDWEWYTDGNTMRVWIHLLIKANWKDGKFKGHDVKRGQLITSSSHLADELKLTRQEIRTALVHLKKSKNLTIKSTNRWMLITIENYGLFQDKTPKPTNKPTINQPTANHNRRKKEEKEILNIDISINKEKEQSKSSSHQTNVNTEQYWSDLLNSEFR